tara:strand:+ start:94 stop:444 length:351 start_codon:yes stop_codon:yes gene_type:complete
MAKLTELLAIPIGLFVVKRFTEQIDNTSKPTPKPDSKPPAPIIPTVKPTIPDVKDFKLVPNIKITEEQLASFDPSKQAEIRPYDPGALVAQPISGGGAFKLNLGNRSLADILQGRR